MANKFLIQINKLILSFIWKGKIERISRKTIIRKLNEGGLNLIDIEIHTVALKINWIVKLLINHIGIIYSYVDIIIQVYI